MTDDEFDEFIAAGIRQMVNPPPLRVGSNPGRVHCCLCRHELNSGDAVRERGDALAHLACARRRLFAAPAPEAPERQPVDPRQGDLFGGKS